MTEREHRWSGWPGAYCLDCGAWDKVEQSLADDCMDCGYDESELCPDHTNSPCPGSNKKEMTHGPV